MKKRRKVVKTYRLQPHLVIGIELMSERKNCTRTRVLEYALARLILEDDLQESKNLMI